MTDSLFQTSAENRGISRDKPHNKPAFSRFCRVSVERGFDAPAGGLTYAIPDELVDSAHPGCRVTMPLGLGKKLAAGIILDIGDASLLDGYPIEKVKPIASVSGGALPRDLVALAQWMSEYYICPMGMVLSTMMPAAVKKSVGVRTRQVVSPVALDDAVWELKTTPSASAARDAIRTLPHDTWPIPPKELKGLLELRTIGPINKLLELGVLVQSDETYVRSDDPMLESLAHDSTTATPPPLTSDQQHAADGINTALTTNQFGVHLIHGVTGSGKTEVYLQLIQRVLDANASAIVLVPEISLTPQTAGRFHARFADSGVVVLHSGLTASQRSKAWARASDGSARVVVGARSAVFAPVPNLKLIIVDEEHATDYKQDQLPRYHARDVAIVRAKELGASVVMGSATPSLESWANATGDNPRYTLWSLPRRVGDKPMPTVRIVDLMHDRALRAKQDIASLKSQQLVSIELETQLHRTLEAGGQAILLLNRRGYAGYLHCPNAKCGWVLECSQCDARLVHHRGASLPLGGVARCHHCLSESRVPRVCPACQGNITKFSLGTQRLEDELEQKFIDVPLGDGRVGLVRDDTMLRIDGDTMTSAKTYHDALSRFATGDVRVLLGTQMLAKGHDFPNVRLVGVVSADTAMHLPDFRAAERTFQLVSQVAGRAGRGDQPGLVIVQTMEPTSTAIVRAASHDYIGFATQELAVRTRSHLPPAWRCARIVVRDEDHDKALSRAQDLAQRIRATSNLTIDGPMDAPINRLHNQWRIAIELRAPGAGALLAPLRALRSQGLLKSDAKTAVDIDPVGMM
ncbi:MAG: primosomal protein N' [Phycisphaeraceae bacterium]|nr:primosomal protein N' [Phycisphaerales bacterium]MCB9859001.1 primosomal protein N' [Phycisphaeraceae bacterium]